MGSEQNVKSTILLYFVVIIFAKNANDNLHNKLGLSWAKLSCQLGLGCTVIFCLILINLK